MRRRIAVLLACLVLAVAAWAGDPWKEKTYKEWNEKEVHRILGDSPWARVVTVPAFWRGGSGSLPGTGGGVAAGEGGGAGETVGGVGRAVSGSGESVGGGGASETHFTVRWTSARTTREALARRAVLRGTPEAEADRIINLPVTEHQIVLFGSDMMPFAKSDEKSLMGKTFLKLKKTKQKISPTRVEIIRGQDGKRITAIAFTFPMKSDAGEPLIAADEKRVEFECHTEVVAIRQNFEPHKMVSKAGPDLQ